jgi:hypothetical protein
MKGFQSTLSRAIQASALFVFGAMGSSLPASAREVASHFSVSVTLRSAAGSGGNAGVCRTDTGVGSFGAAVTVVCGTTPERGSSWLPISGDAYRFLTHVVSRELSGTIDSYAGVGTSTAFRVVNLAGREYVEMTVGW